MAPIIWEDIQDFGQFDKDIKVHLAVPLARISNLSVESKPWQVGLTLPSRQWFVHPQWKERCHNINCLLVCYGCSACGFVICHGSYSVAQALWGSLCDLCYVVGLGDLPASSWPWRQASLVSWTGMELPSRWANNTRPWLWIDKQHPPWYWYPCYTSSFPPNSSLPSNRSDWGSKASSWEILQETKEIWTFPASLARWPHEKHEERSLC